MNSVEVMNKSLLCTGCGTCSGMCPNKAIDMKPNKKGFLKPHIVEENCDSCGICLSICPALKKPEKKEKKVNKKNIPPILGDVNNIYTGYSEINKLRKNCSSGGITTTLLYYLLDNDFIDYAVVAKQNTNDIFDFQPKLAFSKDEVIKSSGSKYIPVPQSISISEILKQKGKCAFVGLPCHIQGIQNAMEKIPDLKDKIKFKISLFCGGTTSINATKHLLNLFDISDEEVENIDFRGGGWPGRFRLKLKNGMEEIIPYDDLKAMGGIYSSLLYRPFFCSLCNDPFGYFSDLSLGDAWHEKNKDDVGRNIIISRNKRIEKIIFEMKEKEFVFLKNETIEDVLSSNMSLVKSKYYNNHQKSKFFTKIYKKEIEPKNLFENSQTNPFNRVSVSLFLIFKKLLRELDSEKMKNEFPLFGFNFLKVINLLERGI